MPSKVSRRRAATRSAGRAQLARLLFIQQRLREGAKVTITSLADELNETYRVIENDLVAMRTHHQLDIEWCHARQSFKLSGRREILLPVEFTPAEITAMAVCGNVAASLGGAAFAQNVEAVMKKLSLCMNLRSARDELRVGPYVVVPTQRKSRALLAEMAVFNTLMLAGKEGRALECIYRKVGDRRPKIPPRVLHPYNLVFLQGRWMVLALDPSVGAVKEFRLSRFERVDLLEGTFTVPSTWNVVAELARTAGRFLGKEDVVITARVTEKILFYLEEEPWAETQVVETTPDARGWYRVSWRVSHTADLQRHLLECGGQAVAVSPESFRLALMAELQRSLTEHALEAIPAPVTS